MALPDTLAFLRAILPTTGFKCATHIVGQQVRQYFYSTHEELASALLRCDALGGNVYHGCAAYSDRRRTQASVSSIRAFWLDIDVAPKSDYEDAYEAAQQVVAFSERLGHRGPCFVGSGRGLHPYWPLADAMDRSTWERYARGLKGACEAFGLQAGRERTADCASILRPPGSHWRKEDEPRLVECGPIPEPFTLDELSPWLEYSHEPVRKISSPRANALRASGNLAAKIQAAKAPEIVDFKKLADRCRQVGALREFRGNVSEPIWHAHTVLLAHCHDGDVQAHLWSAGHPNYTFEETQSYLERGREKTGPTTCRHFGAINPAGCKGCPYDVSTPLGTLGVAARQQDVHRPVDADAVDGGDSDVLLPDVGEFTFRGPDKSLCIGREENDGKSRYDVVCPFPVQLDHVQYGEIRTASRFYHLRHYLPHHGWLGVELPASAARSQQLGGVFADLGLNVHDPDAFRRFITLSVDVYNKARPMQIQYEQYGWKAENAFLYGDRLYTPEETTVVPGSQELKFRNQWLQPRKGGSLDGWKSAADKLFGAGSEGQSFAILASFAAPFLRLVNDSEGGVVVSLVTRATGTGKSTALAGAYSVFASDRRALSLTTTDTGNSKGVALATLGNLPVIHDEFEGDPEVTKAFIKLFTEGRDKQRLDRDGQMRHTVGTWQTVLFTASNASLVDSIGSLGSSDALAYRVLEFPVESSGNFSPAEADRLRKQLELNAGFAGHYFLEYIVRPDVLEWVKARLPAAMEEIYASRGFGKEHRFWVRCLACVAVAAQVVSHLGLVSFSPERIMRWALEYFASKERPVASDMRTYLGHFLNSHAAEMLVVPGPFHGNVKKRLGVISQARLPNKLTIRREEDTGTYYIAYDPLRAWLTQRDVSIAEFVHELTGKGIVRGVKNRTLGAGTSLGGGQVKVVDVDGEHPALTGVARIADGESESRAAR